MITTQAVIKAIDTDTNTCTIQVPLFNTVRSVAAGIPNTAFALPPGFINPYKAGDEVFVSFINNEVNQPVVMGRLYSKQSAAAAQAGGIRCSELTVTNTASLPITTSFSGAVGGFSDLGKLLAGLVAAQSSINANAQATDSMNLDIKNINEAIEDIKARLTAIENNITAIQNAHTFWILCGDLRSPCEQSLKLNVDDPNYNPDNPDTWKLVWDNSITNPNFTTDYNTYGGITLPSDPNYTQTKCGGIVPPWPTTEFTDSSDFPQAGT